MAYPSLSDDEKLSLTNKVYQSLKKGILSFEIKPKEYLIIGEVAKAYGISRTPVREALILLEKEGWVVLKGIRGAMVTWPTRKVIIDAIHVKKVLAGYVIKDFIEIINDEDIKELERIIMQSEKALLQGEYKKSELIGSRFHSIVNEKYGNMVLLTIIDELQEKIDRVRPLIWEISKEMLHESVLQHRAILDAIIERDSQRAERLIFEHSEWFEEKLIPSMNPILD